MEEITAGGTPYDPADFASSLPEGESQAASPQGPADSAGTPEDRAATSPDDLREKIIEVLKTCYDPEIPVNIYDLGLIYDIRIDPPGAVTVYMTLTAPGCPVAFSLPVEVETKIRSLEGVTDARVELVWDPPWTPDRMSEAARLQLGWW